MGLTGAGVGKNAGKEQLEIRKKAATDCVVALVGNPNVGKSTVFNALTGLHQHTGNWPGKTVTLAQGRYDYQGKGYVLVDLPGTYSLVSQSEEERVTADFVESGQADLVLVVCDGTCLERNLSLALQVTQKTKNVMLCVNLLDEAKKQNISVDLRKLGKVLGIPVVGCAAGKGEGIVKIREQLSAMAAGRIISDPISVLPRDGQLCGTEDFLVEQFVKKAEEIASCTVLKNDGKDLWQTKLDRVLMGKFSGGAIMLLLLMGLFWLTIQGANYPTALLQSGFDWLREKLCVWLSPLPWYLTKPFIDGVYATTARVISVMLPPMAIFFPIFTLLEDFGYLPRVAFLLDHRFQKCGSCGKQALSLCMGFGCNAAGVVGCRIIDSPRERLIAILTNSFVPCNGRFPMLISLIVAFFAGSGIWGNVSAVFMLTGTVLLGIGMTFLASKFLSKTVLRGELSSFAMEIPPFRRPKVGQILVRSLLDRTVYILGRAVAVAAPAGLVIWLVTNFQIAGVSVLQYISNALNPIGMLLGMNGVILAAFILGFPANELVMPMILLALSAQGNIQSLGSVLVAGGWTWKTALCTMIFTLFHWPCSTTVLTIYKETGSKKWAILGVVLPTFLGVILCFVCNLVL